MNNQTKNCKCCGAEMPKRLKVCENCGAKYTLISNGATVKTCKKCGKDVASNIKKCPHCGAKTPTGIVSSICAALSIFIVILLAVILIVAISGEEPSANNNYSNQNEFENVQEAKNDVLFENQDYKITYIDFQDPKLGVTSFNLLLKIENNSNKEIIASLTDGYANDTSVLFMTGLPVIIAPGKKANAGFILGYANLGIDSIDDIKKLEFKFTAIDSENYKEIYSTETIVLEY